MNLLHALLNALDTVVSELVSAQSQAKIIGSNTETGLNFFLRNIINLIQTDVKVFELRVDQQPPVGDFCTRVVLACLALKSIKKWHDFLWLLAGLQLLVLLDNGVSFLEFELVGGHLISWEGLFAEALEERHQILTCQVVLGNANIL